MASNTKKTTISYNILHITPHLGGGVGTVLLNWLCNNNNKNNNIIATLDFANDKAKKYVKKKE